MDADFRRRLSNAFTSGGFGDASSVEFDVANDTLAMLGNRRKQFFHIGVLGIFPSKKT